MAKRGYYDVVRERVEQVKPDLSQLLSYRQIAERYGERFRALGFRADSKEDIQSTLRAVVSRRVLHRYEVAGQIRIPANEVEIYLDVLEEPRPVA